MKKNVFIVFVLCFAMCLISCGDKQKKEHATESNNQINPELKQESVFKIKLNLIIPNDDIIEVFYLDFDDTNYSYKTKVSIKVKGNPKAQDIEVALPKDVFPYSLRIDFGQSKSLEDITLNAIAMSYEDFALALTPQEFYAFFMPNQYINYSKESGVIERQLINEKYDPYFNARAVLKKKLELEAR